jgi:ribulose kinase
VFRATGDDARSQCTTTCKWLFRPGGWDAAFWEAAGLAELAADGCRAIGRRVAAVGEAVGRGVCDEAARELGLLPGTTVAAGLIDAHAGALALLNAPLPSGARSRRAEAGDDQELEQRMALICGTSTCHMSLSRREVFVPGVWG